MIPVAVTTTMLRLKAINGFRVYVVFRAAYIWYLSLIHI